MMHREVIAESGNDDGSLLLHVGCNRGWLSKGNNTKTWMGEGRKSQWGTDREWKIVYQYRKYRFLPIVHAYSTVVLIIGCILLHNSHLLQLNHNLMVLACAVRALSSLCFLSLFLCSSLGPAPVLPTIFCLTSLLVNVLLWFMSRSCYYFIEC